VLQPSPALACQSMVAPGSPVATASNGSKAGVAAGEDAIPGALATACLPST
jgi:hypothetical protein